QDAPESVTTESVQDGSQLPPEQLNNNAPEDFGDMPQEQMTQDSPDSSPTQANLDGVQVSVSPIQRPGAYASGTVVFSDGESAEWLIDYQGRLSLVPQTQGYQPTQGDVVEFQQKLQTALS
ncbi:MAG: hypothetical protein J6B07_02110, partial [Opitutales bacterium]|nr:hypothetical protein [Opitutales bacterium]